MNEAELKSTIAVDVNGKGVEVGVSAIKKSLAGLGEAAKSAGVGFDGVATQADEALKKADRSTKAFVAQVKNAATDVKAELDKLNIADKFELKAVSKGLDPSLYKPYVEYLRTVVSEQNRLAASAVATSNSVAMSAKAMTNAMRGVPAQFTDIIVSLQSGQAPLTVLMQQGGQLKDMFGGVGNAAKALGGYVLGLINPFTIAAATVGALTYAYSQGAKEAQAYAQALLVTGNAAGTTVGQLQRMASKVSESTGATQGAAAEALTAFVNAQGVASSNYERFAGVALKVQKELGVSVADTAAKFSELGKAPLEASIKLNDSMHYLTAEVYQQIKALEEHGDKAGAAAIAQKAYADASEKAMDGLKANLGTAEKAWRSITGTAKDAWDAMLGIGRAESIGDKIAAVTREMAALEQHAAPGRGIFSGLSDSDKEKLGTLKEQLRYFTLIKNSQEANAAGDAKRAALQITLQNFDARSVEMLDKKGKMQREIDLAQADGDKLVAAGLKTQIDLNKQLAAIREKYKESAKVTPGDEFASQRSAAKEWADFYEKFTNLADKAAGKVGELTSAQVELEKYLKSPAYTNMAEPARQLALESAYAAIAQQQLAKEIAQATKENEAAINAYDQLLKSQEKRNTALDDELKKQLEHNDSIGMTVEAIGELEAANKRARADALDRKADLADLIYLDGQYADALRKEAENLRKIADAKQLGAVKQAAENINKSITDALMKGFEKGKSFAEDFRDAVTAMFKNMVLRPVIAAIVSPIGEAFAGASGAQAGQGGGTSALGVAQTLKGVYDTLSGGFTAIGDKVASTVGEFGVKILSSNSTLGTTIINASKAIGTTAGYAAGVGAGLMVGKAISGGYGSNATVNAGTAIGAFFGGPIGAAIGGAVGGVLNRAFGMGETETRAQGIEGKFSAGGFTGNNFAVQHQDGGWFRGDKDWTDRSALDSATTRKFAQGFAGLQAASAQAAMSLGLSADAIANYSQQISVQLTSDAAANEKIITKLFTDMGDSLAKSVAPAIEAFAKDGESASATLSRLSGAITTANAWLSMLRQRLFQVSLAGGDAASKLADAFGGLDNLASASKSFYELYYTDGEKVAAAQDAMAKSLALVGLALPASKDALKDLAGTLDLTTDAGRQAYAVLLSIAPEFATTADLTAKMAADTAKAAQDAAKAASDMAVALVAAFTGGGALTPALNAAQLGISQVASGAGLAAGNLSYMHAVMGDISSAVITFGGGFATLGDGLSAAQTSALDLQDQMFDLAFEAKRTEIDMAGLINALAGVDTTTFVATVTTVFESLATRIKATIDDITTERIAVREAALQIINPMAMSKSAIQAGIDAINTNLPTNAGVVSANSTLEAARANYEAAKANEEALKFWYGITRGQPGGAQARVDYYDSIQVTNQAQAQIAPAEAVVKSAIEAYAAAMQAFAIDASKSVSKLSKLREETVKYYEAQKQLADLMANSAANLRATVGQYRYNQLSPEAQAADLQAKFATAYTTALSVQGDGAALAGYGDKINGLLGPLVDKLTEVGKTGLVGGYIAQAENIAALLESTAPVNYQQDSLNLLGDIDATLAALDASSKSAEMIISEAIKAGSDKTALGLHGVIAAITGQTIPTFATGGSFKGGLRLVGENGPELEATGPSRIFNASQTRAMLGGNTERLEALVEKQARQLEALSFELRAIATATNKTAKALDGVIHGEDSINTVAA